MAIGISQPGPSSSPAYSVERVRHAAGLEARHDQGHEIGVAAQPPRIVGIGRFPPRKRGDDQLDELKDEQGREERSDAERQDRDGLSFQQVAQATQRLGVEAWNGDLAAEAVNEKNACGEKQTTAHLRPKQRRKNIVCPISIPEWKWPG